MKNYRLNKYLLSFVLVISFGVTSYAQSVTSDPYGGGFVSIRSYDKTVMSNFINYLIHIKGPVQIDDWSLSVKLIDPIRNGENKVIDPGKIKLRWSEVAPDSPSFSELGIKTGQLPLQPTSTDLVLLEKSYTPISAPNQEYRSWRFLFDLTVEGGAYLEKLKSWNQYSMNLIFTIRDGNKNIVTEAFHSVSFQIYPDGNIPIDPEQPVFGFSLQPSVRNGFLEFSTLRDYIEGVSQTYAKALTVTAETDYVLRVHSINNHFEGDGTQLPLDIVRVELKESNSTQSGGGVKLSSSPQTLIFVPRSSTRVKTFDIRYYTEPHDQRILDFKPANYKTTLIYTLLPQ